MKKLSLITLLLFIFCLTNAQQINKSRFEERDAYAGIKLGDTITNLKVRTSPTLGQCTPDRYGKTSYTIKDKSLYTINGKSIFESIVIDCIDNKVWQINLIYNQKNSAILMNDLTTVYGSPTADETKTRGSYLAWGFDNTVITLILKPIASIYSLTFLDLKLFKLRNSREYTSN